MKRKKPTGYLINQIVNVMSWGQPIQMRILEWDKYAFKYKCQSMEAQGSCYYTSAELSDNQERVNQWHIDKQKMAAEFWNNGGDNGPTGHGDICHSDADPGL